MIVSRALQKIRNTSGGEDCVWLTVYSDLMTNLMLFFLLLYGVTRMAPEVRAQVLEGLKDKFTQEDNTQVEQRAETAMQRFQEEETALALDQALKEEDMTSVEITENRIQVTLRSPALFKPGRAELEPLLKKELNTLALALSALPNTILVEGHTDDVPVRRSPYGSNWALSVARANKVIHYFTTAGGLPAERFVAAGYGEFRPVVPNDSNKNRSLNRRIEINLIRKSNDAGN